MQRVKRSTAVVALPNAPAGGTPGYFANPNPGGGVPATVPGFEWFNSVQEEICSVISAAGLTLDIANVSQLSSAIQALINAALPAGSVVYVPKTTPPAGYLKANGATVSRVTYAVLFAAIGTTFGAGDGSTTFGLPDLRGEFLRGWDDSRGVDSSRALGSSQLDQMQGHLHGPGQNTSDYWGTATSGGTVQFPNTGAAVRTTTNTGSSVADGTNGTPRTGAETRPRNIALLACIKF